MFSARSNRCPRDGTPALRGSGAARCRRKSPLSCYLFGSIAQNSPGWSGTNEGEQPRSNSTRSNKIEVPFMTVYNILQGRNAAPVSSETSAARTTTVAALGGCRPDLPIDSSLGVYRLYRSSRNRHTKLVRRGVLYTGTYGKLRHALTHPSTMAACAAAEVTATAGRDSSPCDQVCQETVSQEKASSGRSRVSNRSFHTKT